jgi:hypothetical protein
MIVRRPPSASTCSTLDASGGRHIGARDQMLRADLAVIDADLQPLDLFQRDDRGQEGPGVEGRADETARQ